MIVGKFKYLFSIFFAWFIFSGVSHGQETGKRKFAEISNNGTNVSWLITVSYESATLSVSAPNGRVFRREFRAGQIPVFAPVTERAEYYGEGRFNYELVLAPVLSPSVKDALAESRKSGNSAEVEADLKRRGLLPEVMFESGTFTVENGAIIYGGNLAETQNPRTENKSQNKDSVKKSLPKVAGGEPTRDADVPVDSDQTIPDDLIVQGSVCAGFDCVENENFGFDTLRLKENNLRIKFDDTSLTNFPANDWQLTANDSASGGANKFSIEDITGAKVPFTITAGAATNSLFIDSTGRLGLRTSTPVLDVHIQTTNTPAIRLDQSNAGGFTAQTWDIGGNEANFFIRDLTNGSRLPFRIRPGAPTSSLDISASGNVGLGTVSPEGPLDIKRGGEQLLLLDNDGKLTVASSLEVESGGITFPDGTTQITAATSGGGGASSLGAQYSQYIFGGQGTIASFSTVAPAIDFNRYGIGTNGASGFLSSTYTIPSNLNLADQTASRVVYKIRYRDADGTGTAAQVRIDLVAVATDGGGRVNTLIFDSNTNSATGFNTVTICLPTDSANFNYANRGMHLNVTLSGTAASNADFGQIQIYKSLSCP